ncbi:MAG: CAP domain-containing protein [Chloroflexi bacterium]|nr:CAP domain-containing protein [Chloroflexota bacterium]
MPQNDICLRQTGDRSVGELVPVIGPILGNASTEPVRTRSRATWRRAVLTVAVTVLALSPHPPPALADTVADDAAAIVAEMTVALDRHRQASLLAPVAVEWSDGAQLHAGYLTQNAGRPERAGLLIHTETPGLPGYSDAGAASAGQSHVSEGSPNARTAIDGLIDAPLHRHALMDPRLTSIGLGHSSEPDPSTVLPTWVIDLASRNRPWTRPPAVVAYPGAGQMRVPLRFPSGEVPDPRAALVSPGSPLPETGYPITLHFFGCAPQDAEAHLFRSVQPGSRVGETDVPIAMVPPGVILQTPTGDRPVEMVLFMSRVPLAPLTAYRAEVTVTCGTIGRATYSWDFVTRVALRPAHITSVVAKPDTDGWQTVTLTVADGDGVPLPVQGTRIDAEFRFENVRTGSTPATSGAPELDWTDRVSSMDGRLRFRIRMRGAARADLKVTVEDDTVPVTVAVVVEPSGSGVPRPVRSALEPFPVIAGAVEQWVAAIGKTPVFGRKD